MVAEVGTEAVSLPIRFPVFPLSGAILLPGGNLPLNIFEPRYLAMTRDAMRTDRVIGMVQPRSDDTPPALFPVGCIGRITSFAETDDGRYLITLTGVCRYDVVEELETTTPYRQVVGSYDRWRCDLTDGERNEQLRPELLASLKIYLDMLGISADWSQIEIAPLDGLTTSLAMICPFECSEKQALLEAVAPEDRTRTLIALMQMATSARSANSVSGRH